MRKSFLTAFPNRVDKGMLRKSLEKNTVLASAFPFLLILGREWGEYTISSSRNEILGSVEDEAMRNKMDVLPRKDEVDRDNYVQN